MERTETPDKIDGVDADDGSFWEKFGERAECDAVCGVVECWYEYRRICDQKVCVARRQTLAAIVERFGHREKCGGDFAAFFEFETFETFTVFFEQGIVGVLAIRLAAQNDGLFIDKAAQVINVSVRVVAGDSSV